MKAISGLLRAFIMLVLYAAFSSGAQLQVDEPPSPGCCEGMQFINTMSFTFSASGDMPPCYTGTIENTRCMFVNESDHPWTVLEIRISPGSELVGCGFNYGFESCVPQQGTANLPSILTFSGGSGIVVGDVLTLSGLEWLPGTTFVVTANPIPEPASVALVFAGVAAVVVARRRHR